MKCPITGARDCQSRQCELHYMSAPLRLARGQEITPPHDYCPVCAVLLSDSPHKPYDETCTDVFYGLYPLL